MGRERLRGIEPPADKKAQVWDLITTSFRDGKVVSARQQFGFRSLMAPLLDGTVLPVVIAVVVGILDAAQTSAWRAIAVQRRELWKAHRPESHGTDPGVIDGWHDDRRRRKGPGHRCASSESAGGGVPEGPEPG